MKLPEMKLPLYEVELLSYPKPVKYRPFTVREEMIMRMANEGGDLDSMTNALKQIINNCLVDEIDVDNMAIVDMITMFLHLRARSISEVGSQVFKCKNMVDAPNSKTANSQGTFPVTKECGMLIEVPVKFLEIPVINKDVERKIKLNDELGVKMKFPTFDLIRRLSKIKPEESEVQIAAGCLELIYSDTEVFKASDCTQEELSDFILKLRGDKYDQIKEFLNNLPKNQYTTKKKCLKCDYEHTFVLEGIQDFFG